VAAVCAAPALAFTAHGIAKGKNVTSYPSFKGKMEADYHYKEVRTYGSLVCGLLQNLMKN